MRRGDALLHANTFHENLRILLDLGEQYLDEEVILAFAANARGCATSRLLLAKTTSSSQEAPTCPPTIDIRDLCSHVDIRCDASEHWGG